MTEFKQIIGRGTRIKAEYGKLYFTIIDFKKATELFADPDFDGDPVRVYVPPEDGPVAPPEDDAQNVDVGNLSPSDAQNIIGQTGGGSGGFDDFGQDDESKSKGRNGGKRRKYVVSDVPVMVLAERVQYYGRDGKLITESLRDYTRRAIREQFLSLDAFLKRWASAERKRAIVDELAQHGVFFEALAEEVGKDLSAFDLICHVAFDQSPLTRQERASNVRKRNYFTKYGETARKVLDALLAKFADEGVDDIEDIALLKVRPLTEHGTPVQIVQQFGGKDPYLKAVRELEDELFRASSNSPGSWIA